MLITDGLSSVLHRGLSNRSELSIWSYWVSFDTLFFGKPSTPDFRVGVAIALMAMAMGVGLLPICTVYNYVGYGITCQNN
jgi:hypothetical protein